MKKYFLFFFIFISIIYSCNLKESLTKFQKINKEIGKQFNHDVTTTYGFGDSDGDYFRFTFYDFDMSQKTNLQLERMAHKVNGFFLKKHPEYKELDFVEVRFTKDDSESDSFVNFKFEQ